MTAFFGANRKLFRSAPMRSINLLMICSATVNILAAMVSQLESKEDWEIRLKRLFLRQKREDPS
jgi:hypothetical protein